jgi:tRNA(fMet)-specific endonuclease VapC
VIVDTNALSAWHEGDLRVRRVLRQANTLVIPVIVVGEYRYGLTRSTRRDQAENWFSGLLSWIRIESITYYTAEIYARVRARLRDAGTPIADNDLWIASLALQTGMPVLSRDADFDRVEGLERVAW